MFGDHRFARKWRGLGLECIAGLTGPVVRSRIPGIVADMNDGPLMRAPMRQQPRRLFFRFRIVARAPIGMIDRLLKIDQQQDRAFR
jgi:hypothetical protein